MIYMAFALYYEAQPFIKVLGLKRDNDFEKVQVFKNAHREIPVTLFITGAGSVKAAAAVAYICAKLPPGPGDIFVNFGICAGNDLSQKGKLYRIHALCDQATGRRFYPDMFPFPGEYEENALVTLPVTAKTMDGLPCPLADMEGTGVYQAAQMFFGQHQILFFKAVYDLPGQETDLETLPGTQTGALPGPGDLVRNLCGRFAETLCRDIFSLAKSREQELSRGEMKFSGEEQKAEADFARRLKATEAMKKKMHQILYYEKVKGGDISGFLEEFGQKHGFDQCSSKKEGMVWLEQMTGDLASKREIKRLNRPAAGRCEMGHGGIGHYFSHIYVEEGVADHEETLRILEHFPNAKVIPIHHYKDVFNRKHQSFYEQKGHPALILAQKEGRLVYPGAPLCQSFGNHYFYYTSCMMNCLYDCEYCYLQGMYPSGNVVLFVNLEDIFREVDELLEKHPVYLCVSYDTDLMAFEGIAGFVGRWHEFVKTRPQLVIEIRTKSGAFDRIKHLKPLPNMIFAWTLSPERIVEKYEHHTASLKLRIRHLHEAADAGFPVRVCFDPLIYEEDFEALYKELVDQVFARPFDLLDASIGVFRVSAEYLKQMRRQRPDSPLLWFPFAVENGAYHYGHELSEKMTETVKGFLKTYVDGSKISVWNGGDGNE